MKIVFRTDASLQIGTGHAMRCLTLADALAVRGAQCQFICRTHEGNLIEVIRAKGYFVHELPASPAIGADFGSADPETSTSDLTQSHWLCATQIQDADACASILAAHHPDWLIVDHYALDALWERSLAGCYRKLMVIDDLADRIHECDLLLDQNFLGENTTIRYAGLVPERCERYLGPKYALLKPDCARLRTSSRSRDGSVRRLLLFMGGSDPSNQTAKVLAALGNPGLVFLRLDVVLGRNHPDVAGIKALVAARPNTTMHRDLPSLAPLMAKADLMIGAGGSTTWERMCLGLPSIVISVADNQMTTNLALMNAGYIEFLGEMESVSENAIVEAIQRSLANPATLMVQSRRAQELVAGDGATIISQKLMTLI